MKRRIPEHEEGKVVSAARRRPLKLIHYEAYALESDARRRETFLKRSEGRRLLRQQIRDVLIEHGLLSANSPGHAAGRIPGLPLEQELRPLL